MSKKNKEQKEVTILKVEDSGAMEKDPKELFLEFWNTIKYKMPKQYQKLDDVIWAHLETYSFTNGIEDFKKGIKHFGVEID